MHELCKLAKRSSIVQVKEVKALIGFFDLDPKRVYDVILEAYEQMPHQEAFLQLTSLFSQDARTQILGFRFVRLADDDVAGCDALYQVTAQLIKVRGVSSRIHLDHLSGFTRSWEEVPHCLITLTCMGADVSHAR